MNVATYLETHTAIVGTTGAGKTVTGKGYVEQLLDDGRQVIVLDPTGAWWGMQSNAAGDGPGYRIPIFGGLHANVPIGGADGARVAQLLVDQRVSAIVDLSEFEDEETSRAFALDFVTTLRTKPIGNLHLVVDEADEFCPEVVPDSDTFKLKRQLAWIAKRGRIRGFVLTIITQRPSDTAKMVLALAQTLVVHRLIAPQDQSPVDRYLKSYADADTRKDVLGSLAALKRGERWVYNPMEGLLERGTSPALRTFDSSAAPIAGKEATEPRALADVDFGALAQALAADRPADDPIAEAEARQPGAWDALVGRVAAIEETIADRGSSDAPTAPGEAPAGETTPDPNPVRAVRSAAAERSSRLPPRHARILQAIAWSGAYLKKPSAPRGIVAWIAETSATSGSFRNDLGALRTAGLIDYPAPGDVALTDAGCEAAPKWFRPGTRDDLWRAISAKLPPRQRAIVDALWFGDRLLSREDLAHVAGATATSGSFRNDLGRLRTLGLIDYPSSGCVRLAELLR